MEYGPFEFQFLLILSYIDPLLVSYTYFIAKRFQWIIPLC